jgi:hypothetical protein
MRENKLTSKTTVRKHGRGIIAEVTLYFEGEVIDGDSARGFKTEGEASDWADDREWQLIVSHCHICGKQSH